MLLRITCIAATIFSASFLVSKADAQIISASTPATSVATLGDQLVNRLRATTPERQSFVLEVVRRTEIGELDVGLVLAVQRYAIRRNRQFPFPFFERAIRFEAAKRNVTLPSVRTFIRSSDVNP